RPAQEKVAMNFARIVAGLPLGADFDSLSEQQQAGIVFVIVERILAEIQRDGREPDEWETNCLGRAIVFGRSLLIGPALQETELAAKSVSERHRIPRQALFDL